MAVHYDKCSSVMMKLLATLRRVYEHLGKCFEPGWLGHLFPPTSTIITARFAQLDTELVATLQELSDVLPSLRSAAQSLSMYRRYTNGTSGWWLLLLMLQTGLSANHCLYSSPPTTVCVADRRADGVSRVLSLRYLADMWEYDDATTHGIPVVMMAELCRQLGIHHSVDMLDEVRRARTSSLLAGAHR